MAPLPLATFDPDFDPDKNRSASDDSYHRFAMCFYDEVKEYARSNFLVASGQAIGDLIAANAAHAAAPPADA